MGGEPGKPEGSEASPKGERDPRLGPTDERTHERTSPMPIATTSVKTAGRSDNDPGFGRDSPAGYAGAKS